jgi:tetratricopeptide (TPR) repeat protein
MLALTTNPYWLTGLRRATMKIFISTVSSQFKACRDALRSDLSAVGAEVVVQEDFQQHGSSLLEKLEAYIASCDRVIALVGDGYGYEPEESARPAGWPRRSYTQWEYYFARGDRLDGRTAEPKPLYVYFAVPEFIEALGAAGDVDPEGLQGAFIAEVRASGKDWNAFKSLDELRALVLRDGFRLETVNPQLRNPSQRAVIQGNHNIAVQIVGDGNSVNIHHPHLSLLRYGALAVRDVVGMLYAQARVIPVIGREDTLDRLGAWAGGDAPISVRVIVGDGGSGKTRLAMELCDRLADTGWDAGFITASELSRFRAQQNLGTWGWCRPTLAVVDDEAAWADLLNVWLSELANNPGTPGAPLRILLLERHADPGRGWWQAAFGMGGASAYAIQGLLDPPEPVRLLPLAPPQRRQILDAMLAKLGSNERVPAEGTDAQFDQRLANLIWGGGPLYLLIAAIRAAQTGIGDLLAPNGVELVSAVARDERTRLCKYAQATGLNDEVLCHMAAFVTLCDGLSWEALADAVPAELQALRRPNGGDPADIVNALRVALPGDEGRIAPILPDAVGEGFVLEVLGAHSAASGAVMRAWQLEPLAVLGTLIRCAQDFGQAELKPPLSWLRFLVDAVDDIDTLIAFAQRVPESIVILRPFAVWLNQRIVERLKQDDPTPDAQQRRARALNNLASRLSALGDREGALGPAQEAVEIRRALAAKNPDAFGPDLAASLNNLANCLSALGAREGALGPAQEAVNIRRALAAKNPDAFGSDLAASLNNLANCLSALGDREGALGAAQEAVEIRRALAAKSPDAFGPDLAASLNNLANCLSALGDREGALGLAQEAIDALARSFMRHPRTVAPWMETMVQNYLKYCQDCDSEPDMALLEPIFGAFDKLKEKAQGKGV